VKPILKSLIVIFLTLSYVYPAVGFGPPGPGKIPNRLLLLQRGFPIFQNVTTPFSYPSLRRLDIIDLIDGNEIIEVEGKSSSPFIRLPLSIRGVLDPTSPSKIEFGNRGIDQAISDALERYQVDYLYDVRIDQNIVTYLYFYNRITTEVHAKGIRLRSDPSEEENP